MSVKAVCFDLDDTLLWDERSVKETFHAVCLRAQEETGVDVDQLEAAVRAEARALYESYETFPFTQMIGINPFEGLWANFDGGEQPEFRALQSLVPSYRKESWYRGLKACGIDNESLAAELGELFASERRSRPYTYEETFQVLIELKGKVKLLLLTNGCPSLQQEKLNGVPELLPYFDHVIISGNFGRGKPDVTIFKRALELLGTSSQETVMVGDKLTTDIKGALAAGIPSVWINRDGKTRNDEIIPDYEIRHLSELMEIVER
ncbi:HAD family hydrolase [Paenibacillus pinistramenti]|uniref:HAD family hydrolase n=1 Tax=Paenibacillus pinistramenti TaxID=1768003 RepID=UPI0011093001|nr:HAD family hydrolase [Paenibacillus pinistramenti]